MARKRKKQRPQEVESNVISSKDKTKRIVIITVSALVGLAILIGAVLGIVLAVQNASYAVVKDGVGITEGVANYLAAYFKSDYKALLQKQLQGTGVTVTDTEAFWSQKIHPDVATTYGDYLKLYVEDAVKSLVCANVIFNASAKLDYEDRAEIAVATEEILNYHADGKKDVFNAECEKYGFNYDDFVTASELLYKGAMLKSKLFGASSEKVTLYTDECTEFFSDYRRVKLLYIRTDKKISYINGEAQLNEDGTYKLDDIEPGSGEYQERMNDIEKLQGIIDGEYDYALFDELWQKYEKENNKELYGCYLYEESKFTQTLGNKYKSVVDTALSLNSNEIARVDDSSSDDNNSFIGSVFVYCVPNESGAYSKTDDYGYFEDFKSLAASGIIETMIEESQRSVELRDKWNALDIINIPYLMTFIAEF